MPVQLNIALIGLAGVIIGGFITWLINRKKSKAETLGIELDNANKVIKIWRDLSEEQTLKIEYLEKKVEGLIIDIAALKQLYEAQCNNCNYRKFYEENNK